MNISSEINNYVETLLSQKIAQLGLAERYSSDQLIDISCLVLNIVPPLYHRHNIDLVSHLSDNDREKLEYLVFDAIKTAEQQLCTERRKRQQ